MKQTLCFYKNIIYIIMIMFSPVCDIPYHLEARLWETLHSGHNGIPFASPHGSVAKFDFFKQKNNSIPC